MIKIKQLISKIVPEVCRAVVKTLSKHVKHQMGSVLMFSQFLRNVFTKHGHTVLNTHLSCYPFSLYSAKCQRSLLFEVPQSAAFLRPEVPSTVEEWTEISKHFEEYWNFPHCLGALDGKHILLQAPIQSGSTYYNYKSTFSIVLMALVDADYNFLYVNIGCQRRVSDGGVFNNCQLYKDFERKKINVPAPSNLPGRNQHVPFVFVADEAFALSENIMKPYSGVHPKGSKERIYNYRLSRARRVV
ncbi:hypothetical protein NQ315_005730 [Exocentrus adspersus]|uniref:DDE Tnp4 domain-containing protein n=1 Tax=Exocentrus adspersus TaxID=1586481 RepID=A0AAV8VIL2_9CUCU|nr:hypothetical protein NQ315_005730 [Exocentrus adspersus]